MPSPLDLIEDGLIKGSFQIIANAYESLTGKRIDVSNLVSTDVAVPANRFVDDGTMEVDLIPESKALSKKAKKKQLRPSPEFVEIKCSNCPRKEIVPLSLSIRKIGSEISPYLCDRCVGAARKSS